MAVSGRVVIAFRECPSWSSYNYPFAILSLMIQYVIYLDTLIFLLSSFAIYPFPITYYEPCRCNGLYSREVEFNYWATFIEQHIKQTKPIILQSITGSHDSEENPFEQRKIPIIQL